MSFGKRAVHTLEGNGTAIGVTDYHAYVDGEVLCLSQGSLDDPICFGKSNRHVVRLDGWGSVLRARVLFMLPVFHNNTFGRRRCTAEFRVVGYFENLVSKIGMTHNISPSFRSSHSTSLGGCFANYGQVDITQTW